MIALLLGAMSCSKRSAAPLRLGLNMWAGSLPFYAAAERKAYGAVKVEFAASESNAETYQAVSQGRLELLSMSLFDALELLDKCADFRIIMATSYSNGADGLVAQRSIATLRDLRGKRISVGIGAFSHLVLLRALEKGGVPEAEVTLVNLSTRQGAEAFQQGKVEAAMLWEPYLSQSHTSEAHTLFTTAEIPAEMPDVLLARSDVIEQRREDLLDVLRGWDNTVRAWNSHPDQIEGVMARIASISLDDLRSGKSGIVVLDLGGSRALFDPAQKGTSIWKAYEATATFMVQHHLLQQPPRPAQEIIDARLVAEAAAK
jgi:NitT/TauT family transport system substrate-binding protein